MEILLKLTPFVSNDKLSWADRSVLLILIGSSVGVNVSILRFIH